MKRTFDILFSLIGIVLLSPLFMVFSALVILNSGFPVIYSQKRVGKNEKDFSLFKFRTMKNNADSKGLLTVGEMDPRITRVGHFLRKWKFDELPQLFNVLMGDMSLVGPRPEVKKYVALYNTEQKKVLSVRPGITDYASIAYSNENTILGRSADPEALYIKEIMPVKLEMNLKYIEERGFGTDLKIILKTFGKIFS